MYVVLYSNQQKAWHIETLREYETKPQNGYFLEYIFGTYEQCSLYVKCAIKISKYNERI
jgi:hypothetical protein